jgi:tetratricopeptide (TPR) repeat protein
MIDPTGHVAAGSIDDDDAKCHVAQGRRLWDEHMHADAERCFLRAMAVDPYSAEAHNNLGWVREAKGDYVSAIRCYQYALELIPRFGVARVNLASLLSRVGRYEDAQRLWCALALANPGDRMVLDKLIDAALGAGDLETASSCAEESAFLHHGQPMDGHAGSVDLPPHRGSASPHVTIAKLQHDIDQFSYLQAHGIMAGEVPEILRRYQAVLDTARAEHDENDRWQLSRAEHSTIGSFYDRIVYRRPAPSVPQALSSAWDRADVERAYLHHPFGLVVVDDFLSAEALHSLRMFCLESVIWFTNRYSHGRLGAMFREGFNCPLLVQIARELASAFPTVIGRRHRLLQLWAFKCGSSQPAVSAHADFAAVNVNFWLTPDEANLDPTSGGLTIYDVEAPMSWDFSSYNKKGRKIDAFLHQQPANSIHVPYRANRAVIFNSDMFHSTQPLSFRDGYENRRINVTFLFGRREGDLQRPSLHPV